MKLLSTLSLLLCVLSAANLSACVAGRPCYEGRPNNPADRLVVPMPSQSEIANVTALGMQYPALADTAQAVQDNCQGAFLTSACATAMSNFHKIKNALGL